MIDMNARYAVKGYRGIAFYVWGFPKFWDPYLEEWEQQDESCGRVIVVMVGDDRQHEVNIEDLTLIPEDSYCSECGQIGCKAYG